MKKLFPLLVTAVLAIGGWLSFMPTCEAEIQALKRECETKAKNAADLIQKKGPEAAFAEITDPKGNFVNKTSHVFCIDADSGHLLAHKVPRFVGANMHYYTDADGNHPYTGILKRAGQTASGWTSYMTYGSGPEKRKAPALKNMYFLKVPDKKIVLCCGYWEDR